MKLLIRNLDRSKTEKQLKAMFEEFGVVQSCSLVMDKETNKSKGFGFVEMPKIGDAKAAIKNLNNKIIGGNKLRVKKTEDKKVDDKKVDDKKVDNKKSEKIETENSEDNDG